jgi:hypothetical protein
MRRAIADGRERVPRMGVFKDPRRLTAPRLFEPVPEFSGCTSPALECAESEKFADSDWADSKWTRRLIDPDHSEKEEP